MGPFRLNRKGKVILRRDWDKNTQVSGDRREELWYTALWIPDRRGL